MLHLWTSSFVLLRLLFCVPFSVIGVSVLNSALWFLSVKTFIIKFLLWRSLRWQNDKTTGDIRLTYVLLARQISGCNGANALEWVEIMGWHAAAAVPIKELLSHSIMRQRVRVNDSFAKKRTQSQCITLLYYGSGSQWRVIEEMVGGGRLNVPLHCIKSALSKTLDIFCSLSFNGQLGKTSQEGEPSRSIV